MSMAALALKSNHLFDVDATNYFNRIESSSGDNQRLEYAVKLAINTFVLGCKADNIWNAIKASCILAGARTLNGALQPLVGTAPTNFNFVPTDYNRKTGLIGNDTDKYLNANRNNNADPQNSHHLASYCTSNPTIGSFPVILKSTAFGVTGATQLYRRRSAGDRWEAQSRNAILQASTNLSGSVPTFVGVSRGDSTTCIIRANGTSGSNAITSEAPGADPTLVYAYSPGVLHFNGRLSFYSIGENLDLSLLDARLTTLMTALNSVIS